MRVIRISLAAVLLAGAVLAQQPPPPNYPQQYPPQYPQQPQAYPQGTAPPAPVYQQPQYSQNQPPILGPAQLEPMVARIALYPDGLLGQVLAAAGYPEEIPDAARWGDQHHYLSGQVLANAILADRLPWAPPVQALLPFPSVLDMMASDMNWTYQLGSSFLVQQADVMEAIQRQRARAMSYGYLRTSRDIVVNGGPYITIMPRNPLFLPVPYYDPALVFYPPRRGFRVDAAINFGFGVAVGTFFDPWGLRVSSFDWRGHFLVLNNARWGRTWVNRGGYAHPYAGLPRIEGPRPGEAHRLDERSAREREEERRGRRVEDHKREERR